MKIQNTFLKGTINKDVDERLVDSNELIDAENFLVSTTEGSNSGVGKNVPGNIKKTSYNILGGKTIGVGDDENNNRIFNCIKGDDFDYIIEYNVDTDVSEIVLQSTTGGVLNFIAGERILNIDVISSGIPDEDLLAISGDSNPPRVFNIIKAKTYGIDGFTETEISVMKPSPIFSPTVIPVQVTTESHTFTSDKFLSFAYRWKYENDFYSAISNWSKYAFVPGVFNLDYDSWENTSMTNIANAIDISFKTGTRHVVGVDILMKKSNSDIIYLVEKFKKEDELWGDDQTKVFQFNNSKIYTILPEQEYFRQFDNVPLKSVAQAVAGNRLMYANFEEQRDIDTIIDLKVDFDSEALGSGEDIEKEILDSIYSQSFSNIIDFKGPLTGAILYQYSLNSNENEYIIDNSDNSITGNSHVVLYQINVTNNTPYDLYVIDELNQVVHSDLGIIGTTHLTTNNSGEGIPAKRFDISPLSNGQIKKYRFYIESSVSLEYDFYFLTRKDPFYSIWPLSAYRKADAINQISKSKSSGSIPVFFGDTVSDTKISIDLIGFEFKKDKTLFFSFDIQSINDPTNRDNLSLFYILEDDYIDLNDFFTNSNFNSISNISAYSQIFKDIFLVGSSPVISEQGFDVSILGDVMSIKNPYYLLEVTEASDPDPSPDNKENKYFFYKNRDFHFESSLNGFLSSLHSNRDYEAGIIYLDEQGRETTVLASKENTVYIPPQNSITQNKLVIDTPFLPPSWAKYYKFAIKQTKNEYHTIIANTFYEDGAFKWIKLDGENKNKVKDGDVLIVKADLSGPLISLIEVKVLEVKDQDKDFIFGNADASGNTLSEASGLYFKIKPVGFDVNYTSNTSNLYSGSAAMHNGNFGVTTQPAFGNFDENSIFVPSEIQEGTFITIDIVSHEFSNGNRFEYQRSFYASVTHDNFQLFFDAEVATQADWIQFMIDHIGYQFEGNSQNLTIITRDGGYGGSGRRSTVVNVTIKANNVLIFETKPKENLGVSFFKTPEVFTIVNGEHNSGDLLNPNKHVLNNAYNCFSFGNGCESNRIKDSFTGEIFGIDNSATNVSADIYKKINRFADITYSGIFNSNTGLNQLNSFNLSLVNYKEDIEKAFGPIMKIVAKDTNLDVYQEDKTSKVLYGKNILFNADGTSNVSKISEVLGQQLIDIGEYGISYHPDSYDNYAFNTYFTDTKRGVVLKKNHNNGLFEVSFQGMRNYFKKLFRDNNINHINGQYDQFHDYYLLNIQYNNTEYVTWVYSDKDNGWLGRLKFNPEDMIRINNHLISFKNGEVYLHNQESNYNTFYEIESPSTFSFNFSQIPSDRKTFKTISIEGTVPTDVILKTEHDNGYINKEDFSKKEGVFYAYVRNSNDTIDTAKLSCQGLGVATVNGLILEFTQNLDPTISVGDKVVNVNLALVGTITAKTDTTVFVSTVNNITTGDFVLVAKPQSIEEQCLLGYYMQVKADFSSNTSQEIFAVNAEISKSFE